MPEAIAISTPAPGNGGTPPPLAAPPAAPAVASPAAPVTTPSPAATRPENLPEQFWDTEKGSLKFDEFLQDYHGLSARVAEHDAVRAAVPEKPEAYTLDLPKDFKGPDGFEFAMDEKDALVGPVLGEFRKWAHGAGLNQEQVSQAVGLMAQKDVAEYQALQAASKAQMESLGANGTARVDAVTRFLMGHLGEPAAKSLLGTLFTKTQVESYEALMRLFSSRGVPAPKSGGEATVAGKPNVEQLGEITSASRRFAAAMAMSKAKQ